MTNNLVLALRLAKFAAAGRGPLGLPPTHAMLDGRDPAHRAHAARLVAAAQAARGGDDTRLRTTLDNEVEAALALLRAHYGLDDLPSPPPGPDTPDPEEAP